MRKQRTSRKKVERHYPTSIRLTDEMRKFLRGEAEQRGHLNNRYRTGDITYMVSEILEYYRGFVTKSKNRKINVPK